MDIKGDAPKGKPVKAVSYKPNKNHSKGTKDSAFFKHTMTGKC